MRHPSPRRAPILVTMTRSSRIRMQRFADQLVGDVRTIEIAGVDVVHAARDCLAQHGQRRAMILGRAEHAGAGELHGAVAEPLHAAGAEVERAGLVDNGHDRTPFKRCHAKLGVAGLCDENWIQPVQAVRRSEQ